MKPLRHAAGHIRSTIGGKIRMRRLPQLAFRLDESIKNQVEITTAINEVSVQPDAPPNEHAVSEDSTT